MSNIAKIFIEPEEIINFLKTEMCLRDIYQRILFQRIINSTAAIRGVNVTVAEIEAEANRQRRENHLEKATDTITWLSEQLVTPNDWEDGIRNRLLANKLAEALFAQDVENFFSQHRPQFEQVILYELIVADEKLAQELYYQIEEGEISFYEAAHQYHIDEECRQKCGYEGEVYRWSIQPDIAAIIFSIPPKHLIGPIKTEKGYHLIITEELIPAELTVNRYQEILNQMFQQWLVSELE
ncbi:MAG: peptidylprolyl isomerase [Calothrix sp. MO_192.B10]|nr:peptidylprolyl isomerase [Calothrix sp. MO_192.B10]